MRFTCASIPKGVSVGWLRDLERIVTRRFKVEGTISVAFVPEAEMRRLNMLYRGKETATDVLSFRLYDTTAMHMPAKGDEPVYAEIVFNGKWLRKHAKERGSTLQSYFKMMLIHGVLHTMGYDHGTKVQAASMQKQEQQLARELRKNIGRRSKIQYTNRIKQIAKR